MVPSGATSFVADSHAMCLTRIRIHISGNVTISPDSWSDAIHEHNVSILGINSSIQSSTCTHAGGRGHANVNVCAMDSCSNAYEFRVTCIAVYIVIRRRFCSSP